MRFPGGAGISSLPPFPGQPLAPASLQETQELRRTGSEAEYLLYLMQKLRILGDMSLLPHTSKLYNIYFFLWNFLSSNFLKKHYIWEAGSASVFRDL
jgi:hypothetical protein